MSISSSNEITNGGITLRPLEPGLAASRSATAAAQVTRPGLKILIVVSFANFAGAQIAALRLARGLRDRGHDPKPVFLYEQAPVNGADHPYEVVIPKAKPGIGGYIRMWKELAGIVRREKPDLVLTFLPLANVVGQATAFLAGVKTRVVSHRMPVNTASPIMRRFDTLWARLGIYTQVVAVSDAVRDTCSHYPAKLLDRTVVVHNGLRDWHASTLTREAARAAFGIPDDVLALSAIGRLARQKNYPFMLKVMSRLENVVLLVAGEGALRPELEETIGTLGIEDKVRLLGAVPRDRIPDLLAASDIFIQTSTYEGQSNSVLEAMQAGVPTVAHDVPSQRESMADEDGNIAGDLVPLEDVDAWVAAIERLRDNPAAVERARAVASERVALFGYDAMIRGFEKALTSRVGKG